MPPKKLYVEGVGNVTIKQNPRAKNITLRIIPGPELIVSAPRMLSEKRARTIIAEKQHWIQKKLQSTLFQKNPYQYGDVISSLHFDIVLHNAGLPVPKPEERVIHWLVDENMDREETQENIRLQLREFLRKEAKAYLPQRVAWLAGKFNFSYARVSVKDSKTRWGSCSVKKNINLSLYLMRLPSHLIDYIILHELCHTVHMNHGDSFHQLMARVTDYKEQVYRKELRGYRTGL